MKSAIIFFVISLVFLGAGLYYVRNQRVEKKSSNTASSSRTYLMSMRDQAVQQAKEKGLKNYQFEVSSPLFSPLYFNNQENQK
jgi:hypothetical protein